LSQSRFARYADIGRWFRRAALEAVARFHQKPARREKTERGADVDQVEHDCLLI
jgi:hypothetical protein